VGNDNTFKRLVELPPDLIVQEPEPLRMELLRALDSEVPVAIDATEVRRVGVVALQLLVGFVREAHQKGLVVRLNGVRPELDEALRCTGLDRDTDLLRARQS
jgi:anti-anti-sigma regulatory factor